MNIIIKIVLTLSIAYWTAFYVVDSKGFWLPIPFIAFAYLWFGGNYKKIKYKIRQNKNGEYYIENTTPFTLECYLDLKSENYWYLGLQDCCLTKDLELITKIYNILIS